MSERGEMAGNPGTWHEEPGPSDSTQFRFEPDPGSPMAVERENRPKREEHRQRLESRLDSLEQAVANWADLTDAQRLTATKNAVEGVARLARLVINKLD